MLYTSTGTFPYVPLRSVSAPPSLTPCLSLVRSPPPRDRSPRSSSCAGVWVNRVNYVSRSRVSADCPSACAFSTRGHFPNLLRSLFQRPGAPPPPPAENNARPQSSDAGTPRHSGQDAYHYYYNTDRYAADLYNETIII